MLRATEEKAPPCLEIFGQVFGQMVDQIFGKVFIEKYDFVSFTGANITVLQVLLRRAYTFAGSTVRGFVIRFLIFSVSWKLFLPSPVWTKHTEKHIHRYFVFSHFIISSYVGIRPDGGGDFGKYSFAVLPGQNIQFYSSTGLEQITYTLLPRAAEILQYFLTIFWTRFSWIFGIVCISGGYQDAPPWFLPLFTSGFRRFTEENLPETYQEKNLQNPLN